MKKPTESPLLSAAFAKPAKKSAKAAPPSAAPEYASPSPNEMRRDAAHRGHREVVESWVRGDASTAKMNQSKARLQKALKDCK